MPSDMGSKQSKVARTPSEVLGLAPTATRAEIRERYRSLILQAHPDIQHRHVSKTTAEASEVITAYSRLMKELPPLEEYTEELLKSDLKKYADDVFERIGEYFGAKAPKFSSPDFERFYCIFTNFTTTRDFELPEEKTKCCRNIRRIARTVRRLDGRICEDKPIEAESRVAIPREKKIKEYPICCEQCSKGFHSINQLLNHFRSRKHLEKAGEVAEDPRRYVEEQIQGITGARREEDMRVENIEEVHMEEAVAPAEEPRPKAELRKEPLPFRTCSRCRLIFDSRSELFVHLRTSHRE
jgi:curved DNA-binding protein CbpA